MARIQVIPETLAAQLAPGASSVDCVSRTCGTAFAMQPCGERITPFSPANQKNIPESDPGITAHLNPRPS